MTKRKIILLVVLLLLASSGCKEATQLDAAEFAEKWTTSDKHSAISGWYSGEDENNILLQNNRLLKIAFIVFQKT